MSKAVIRMSGVLVAGFCLGALWRDSEGPRAAAPAPVREEVKVAPPWARDLQERMEAMEEELRVLPRPVQNRLESGRASISGSDTCVSRR